MLHIRSALKLNVKCLKRINVLLTKVWALADQLWQFQSRHML